MRTATSWETTARCARERAREGLVGVEVVRVVGEGRQALLDPRVVVAPRALDLLAELREGAVGAVPQHHELGREVGVERLQGLVVRGEKALGAEERAA